MEKPIGRTPSSPPLALGTKVPGYGKVAMVGVTGGERYYWLTKANGRDVAMVPWFMIEKEPHNSQGDRG